MIIFESIFVYCVSFHLLSFTFSLKNFLLHLFSVGLLFLNSLSLCLSQNCFILLLVLNNMFDRCRIIDLLFLPFHTFKNVVWLTLSLIWSQWLSYLHLSVSNMSLFPLWLLLVFSLYFQCSAIVIRGTLICFSFSLCLYRVSCVDTLGRVDLYFSSNLETLWPLFHIASICMSSHSLTFSSV